MEAACRNATITMKARLMINKPQQPQPPEERIYVSLYPEEFVTSEQRMRRLEAAKGVRLFVSSVAPDIEVALVHRMLLIAHRDFDHMHCPRPDGPHCVMQEAVSIGFVNHDAGGVEPRFWTIPFADDLWSALNLEIKTWWASLVDARRAELSRSFDDDPWILWQSSAGPERPNAHQKPKRTATEIEEGASKNRKKRTKNKKMSFEEWLEWDARAKVAGWAAATGDLRRYAYFVQVYPLLHKMMQMCRAAGRRCEVAVRISYSDGRKPYAVSSGTEELPESATVVNARARAAWREKIQPLANRALRRCLRAGIECSIEFEALGEVRCSGGFNDEAIASIERRLRSSLDRSLGRTNGRSEP